VIAYALAGTLAFDPQQDELTAADGSRFKLKPPVPAPEIPPRGFVTSFEGYQAPPANRSGVPIAVAKDSERLALLEPFAAWDGKDLADMPVLMKAKGKCTTDHISAAGPWLRFRGHLDRISDNLFIGAINAFNGKTGEGVNVFTGELAAYPKVARDYKARGLKWIAIGDENYGEGSSREHAAMEPRHLGAGAVLVRSFARIHETNLKKQGLLPLTFANAADYEKVKERDRVSIGGLTSFAPGVPLKVTLKHADGTSESFDAKHTFSADQIAWYKAGSALNILRKGK
jgi:aconitate hydratase